MKEITDKLIKNFCEIHYQEIGVKVTDWENQYAKDTSGKGLLYKIHKTLKTQQ